LDEVNEEIVRNRTILNFNQETFTLPKVVNTLKALKDGGIKIASIVVDGLDLSKVDTADLKCFSDFVKAEKMTAWFSFTNEASDLKGTLDAEKLDTFATVAHLANEGNSLSLALLKNGSGKVNLDTKTLLMCK
ncbi:MAG: hypothetical protein K5829_04265, partial [Treponema sp.]|nr:hypothetical protein [Treponema sp.]